MLETPELSRREFMLCVIAINLTTLVLLFQLFST